MKEVSSSPCGKKSTRGKKRLNAGKEFMGKELSIRKTMRRYPLRWWPPAALHPRTAAQQFPKSYFL